jgi:hypothetical protein
MTEKAILFYNKMIDDYTETCAKEKAETDKMMRAIWSDKRRKIEKIFQKMFGKPIDKMQKV